MKSRTGLVSVLLIAILLNACSGAETPTRDQYLPVENTPQSTSTIEPATKQPTAQEMTKLTLNFSTHTSFAPIFIAEKEGYFRDQGIELEYVTFQNTTDAVPLVVSGDLDMFLGTVNSGLLNILGQEENIKVVADRGHIQPGECTYSAVMVRKDLFESGAITSAADLAGQPVSSSPVGTSGFLLSTYLAQAGLTKDDIILNEIPSQGYVDAFANKSLAAIVAPELSITRLLKAGNAVILARAEDVVGPLQISVLAFGKRLLVDDRDVGARFLTAYLKGIQQYNEGKTEHNLQILSEATGEDVELLRDACWVTIRSDGSIDFPGVAAFQQWSIEQKQLDNAVTEKQFWDPSFLAEAKKLLEAEP